MARDAAQLQLGDQVATTFATSLIWPWAGGAFVGVGSSRISAERTRPTRNVRNPRRALVGRDPRRVRHALDPPLRPGLLRCDARSDVCMPWVARVVSITNEAIAAETVRHPTPTRPGSPSDCSTVFSF